MVTFDEDIFDAIVTKTVITPDDEIRFTLMGNISFTERLLLHEETQIATLWVYDRR